MELNKTGECIDRITNTLVEKGYIGTPDSVSKEDYKIYLMSSTNQRLIKPQPGVYERLDPSTAVKLLIGNSGKTA